LIVVTVREARVEEARKRIAGLGRGADRVELRLDDLAGQDWQGVIAGSPLPVIATCRPCSAGGGFSGSEEERRAILEEALSCGAACVDVESGSTAESMIPRFPADRVVVSLHDFEPGVATLDAKATRLFQTASGVTVKLAYTPGRVSDCLRGRSLLERAAKEGRRLVLVPMGEHGQPGRILACRWGSAWAYAAPDAAPPAAPGQLSLREMADLYDVDSLGEQTALTGLLGWPVGASLSPWMHNRAARELGLDARYLPFPDTDAADFLVNAGAWELLGVSVTRPHKQTVLPWLDETSAAGRACGAVNTLSFEGGRVRGDNTDAAAALQVIREGLPDGRELDGLRLAVIGAGGGARALAWAAGGAGALVTLYNRDRRRGEAAAAAVGARRRPLEELAAGDADVLVNATPVGTWPRVEDCPVPETVLAGQLVFDLVSNPLRTRLLQMAGGRNIPVRGGLEMLIRQGEAQFRLWHGQDPPAGTFRAAALEGLRWHESFSDPASFSGYNGGR
jgi:3-dehydroquinate dehydratase/shikimate dehydrogenase